MSADEKAAFTAAKPFVRSILAFIMYVRYEHLNIKGSYESADEFIQQLEKDILNSDH